MNDKILKLEKLIMFLEDNNIDLLSCSCCDGIGIEIDGVDISTRTICDINDMRKLLKELKGDQ